MSDSATDNNRREFLSSWAIDERGLTSFTDSQEAKRREKQDRRVGYVFCKKCYEIVRSNELKCPNCGHVINK